MKTINLILILITFTLNIMGQSKKHIHEEKGEVETYKISNEDGSIFIYNIAMPNLIINDEIITKYKVWPKRTLVNDKEYVSKYLKPKIKGEIDRENSMLSISYYYDLFSGKLKWITISYDNSIAIPIKTIEEFEKVMRKEDKAIYNRETSSIKDIPYFRRYVVYDLSKL